MRPRHRSTAIGRPSLSWFLLCALVCVLWVAGGSSRADGAGQFIVRAAATAAMAATILFSERVALAPRRPVALFLLGAIAIAAAQLVPLPPSVWTALPGRAMIEQAAVAAGEPQPWRPWSIVPGMTANALFSLLVPLAIWLLVTGLRDQERRRLPVLILCLAIASTLLGLLQLTGGGLDHPLVDDTPGMISGSFANRNHFAVFLACAILLVPSWAFVAQRGQRWRAPAGLALVTLFLLMILATGSRAGAAIGVAALFLGVLAAREDVRSELRRHPRWLSMASIAGAIAAVASFVAISITAERAVSVDRALSASMGEDMRSRGLPVVLSAIREYFPAGSGLGSFDAIFRAREPFDLLKPTYFNHAHNDLLEIVLDSGVAGLLLLGLALTWLGVAGARAWYGTAAVGEFALGRLGSAMLLMIVIASVFDYPARTPFFMALIVLAASWLDDRSGSALPVAAPRL